MASEQSPKYAICGNSPARGLWYKLETFLKIREAESNRTTQKLNSRHLLFLYLPWRDVASPTLSRRLPIDGPVMAWHFSSYAKSNRKACEMTPRTTRLNGPVMAWHFFSYAKSNRKACEMTPRTTRLDGPVMTWHFSSYTKSNRKACEMSPRTTRFLKLFLHVFFARSTFCLSFGQVRVLF